MADTSGATRPISAADMAQTVPPMPVMPPPAGGVHAATRGAAVSTSSTAPASGSVPPVAPPSTPRACGRPAPDTAKRLSKTRKKSAGASSGPNWFIIGAVLLAAILGAGAWTVLGNRTSVPQRMTAYTITDIPLRNYPADGSHANIYATAPFGTSLEILGEEGDWAKVKTTGAALRLHRPNEAREEGYVRTEELLEEPDYLRLAGIFASGRAASQITEVRERHALLHYFRANGFAGEASPEAEAAGLQVSSEADTWRFMGRMSFGSGEIYRDHIFDPNSLYPDFAFVLHSPHTEFNRLVIYSFTDDGTPVFRLERQVGDNHIITRISSDESQPDGVNVMFQR